MVLLIALVVPTGKGPGALVDIAGEAAPLASGTRHPVLTSSVLFGGNGFDNVADVALDARNNVYVAGHTTSANLATAGTFQEELSSSCETPPCVDAFVAKLKPDGGLVWATYLGGGAGGNTSGYDFARGLTVDQSGSVYVVGVTSSADFPTTQGSFKSMLGPTESGDAFVTKIDPSGSSLVYSTYLGGQLYGEEPEAGDGTDEAKSVAVDSGGNAYVVGTTSNADFPVRSTIQPMIAGGTDAFVAKLDPTGSQLLFSTFLGGEGDDTGNAVDVGDSGTTHVVGTTSSDSFLTTSGAAQTASSGGADAFMAKIDATGERLEYSSRLGGSSSDFGFSVTVGRDDEAWASGTTKSSDFPTSSGAVSQRRNGGFDGFISRMSSDGTKLGYSTFLGGRRNDGVNDVFAIGGSLLAVGATRSSDFPTVMPLQAKKGSGFDAFVARLDSGALDFSSFLGGNSDSGGLGDASVGVTGTTERTFVAGTTDSRSFPTINASRSAAFGLDGFILRLGSTSRPCSITGSRGRDTIKASWTSDLVCGRGGADILRGRGGDDFLYGGRGLDICIGGRGRDHVLECEKRRV